ncbi:MAG: glycosyltransferase family 4 protein [Elusimicrobiota bacterium]
MRIIYNHRTRGKGGEGVHIDEIVKAFTVLGNEVDVLSPAGLNAVSGTAYETPWLHRFISRHMPELVFEFIELAYNRVAYKKLKKQMKQKEYTLIFERYAIFNTSGIRVSKKTGVPIILEVNYTSFTHLYRKRSKILAPVANRLDRKILEKADGIVVVSGYLKDHLIRLGIRPEKIIILANAADPEKFSNAISGMRIRDKYSLGNAKVIGFIGGFYPWHGLDMLLKCFSYIRKEVEETKLLLIGDGLMRAELEKMALDSGIQEDVIFTGKVDHEELPGHIAAFDVAVMPDSNEYGSPMKIYEYMAMAKPVVAPRLGPLEEGINSGEHGLLFDRGDITGLTGALVMLLKNDELRMRMGRAGRENIISEHNWKNNACKIIELYNRVKGKKK